MTAPHHYPGYGTPIRHKRRRPLINGYTYNSANEVLSPRGQLLFRRRNQKTGKMVHIEGDMIQLFDAMRRLEKVALRIKKTLGRRRRK